MAPLCKCGRVASLVMGTWWRCSLANGADGCDYEARYVPPRAGPRPCGSTCSRRPPPPPTAADGGGGACALRRRRAFAIDDSLEGEGARRTAALLTAAAYGPMNRAAFVAPCDCGLGLFARIR